MKMSIVNIFISSSQTLSGKKPITFFLNGDKYVIYCNYNIFSCFCQHF